MYLIHRIEEVAATYDDSRRALAEYVLREHTRLPELTIADVARETYTSKASVTRFAKALGFEGWREFLREFVREGAFERQHAADVDVNFPFAAQDSDGRILENIGDLMAESVAATYAQLDRGMLAMAVRHLQRAERVWVFGRTPNHYYGESFCRKLLAIGKQATAVSPGDMGIVARLADRVGVIYAGALVEEGSRETMFRNPEHPYTRGLMHSIPSIKMDRKHKGYSMPGLLPNLISPSQV